MFFAIGGALTMAKDLWAPAMAIVTFSFARPWFFPVAYVGFLIAYWLVVDTKVDGKKAN